eukprot:CAMPEP_0203755052 /NCGR_PEP_ID=MMETSP0098-20131031/8574_1 /ASSEMBLY_ACC=CAM_ASM_000208 /TAXON_ID=96639 /ORGANISM=" , Strain NY0313808BC1" /LENGTH=554 /DNA_ID=CAMNT_0050646359 /DNA_START=482 /DNA_END=2143 /DNA_ORIENTATION=-
MDTEEVYCGYLKVLLELFLPAIEAVIRVDAKRIFSNVRQLYSFSKEFQIQLREAVKKKRVGELYKQIGPFYNLYTEYCNNHEQAVRYVGKLLQKNKDFRAVVSECESKTDQTLFSLLIMPIQRVPRHILLLEEIHKALTPQDADFSSCIDGIAKMKQVAIQINESIRKTENANQLWVIQNSLTFPDDSLSLFENSRVLKRDGELLKICGRKHKKKRRFILFSDCLVYAKKGFQKWVFRRKLSVQHIRELPGKSALSLGSNHSFILECIDQVHSKPHSIVCVAESFEQKTDWIAAIREHITQQQTNVTSSKANLLRGTQFTAGATSVGTQLYGKSTMQFIVRILRATWNMALGGILAGKVWTIDKYARAAETKQWCAGKVKELGCLFRTTPPLEILKIFSRFLGRHLTCLLHSITKSAKSNLEASYRQAADLRTFCSTLLRMAIALSLAACIYTRDAAVSSKHKVSDCINHRAELKSQASMCLNDICARSSEVKTRATEYLELIRHESVDMKSRASKYLQTLGSESSELKAKALIYVQNIPFVNQLDTADKEETK